MSVIGQPRHTPVFAPSVVAATGQVGQDAPHGRQIESKARSGTGKTGA